MLATEPRAKQEARSVLCHTPVATFEQSENITIAHLVGLLAVRGVASAIIGTGSKFMPLPSAHVHDTNAQAGYCLYMNYVSMFCEQVLIMHTSHIIMIVTLNILIMYCRVK